MNIESRFTFSAGMVIRKTVVSKIKTAAFKAGVNINIDEDKGFLSSNYRVTLSGESEAVKQLREDISSYFEQLDEES